MDKIVNGLRIWPIRSIQTMWRVRQRVHTLCTGGCNQTNRRTEPHSIISIVVDGKLKNKSFANALTKWMLVQSSAEKKTPYYTDSFNYNQSKMMKNTLAHTHTTNNEQNPHFNSFSHYNLSFIVSGYFSKWWTAFCTFYWAARAHAQNVATLPFRWWISSWTDPIRCKNQDAHA